MAEASASFNLLDRPWLLAHSLVGDVRELTIVEALRDARELSALVGELPTMTFALTRLLLAFLERACDGPADEESWTELWHDGPPMAEITNYAAQFHDRFDLFDPVQPFFQVADLHTSKNEVTGLERLIAEVPNNIPFFTTRIGPGVDKLAPAEAARWVVHCQAFDPSGIKTGAVGDARVKGGRGYPIGVAWSGLLGGLIMQGRNLWETLLLNLIPRDSNLLDRSGEDLPPWERPQLTSAADGIPRSGNLDFRPPTGPVDLMTWQSRRIRLFRDGDSDIVNAVLICNGDKRTPQFIERYEPMSAWRKSVPQAKKYKVDLVYMPLEHSPDRKLWRSVEALLPNIPTARQTKEGSERLPAASILWTAEALDLLELDDYVVRVHALGMVYGSNNSVVDEVIDDQLDFKAILLSDRSALLAQEIVEASRVADLCIRRLGFLGKDLAIAAGARGLDPGDGNRDRAKEAGYDAIGRDFMRWLNGLTATTTVSEARRDWHQKVNSTLLSICSEMVEQAGPRALVGGDTGGRHYDAGLAEVQFRAYLRKTLPAAFPDSQGDRSNGVLQSQLKGLGDD